MDDRGLPTCHHRHLGKGKQALDLGLLVFVASLVSLHLVGLAHSVYQALVGLSY